MKNLWIFLVSLLATTTCLGQPGHIEVKQQVPHVPTFPAIEGAPFPYVPSEMVGVPKDKLEKLRQEIKTWVENGDVVGNEILIMKDEKIIFHEAFGWSDRETNLPVQRNSYWNIRSMTKPITATVVMMLEEEGKLSLEDRIIEYIPKFKGNPETTIGHMLSHTSGYARSDFEDYDDTTKNLEEWVMTGALKKPTGTFGEYEYTDFGLVVACYIVHQVTGKSLEEHIEQRIIGPLGLKGTRVNFSDDPEWRARINTWYIIDPDSMKYRINWPRDRGPWKIFGGAWGMFSTVTDYAKFLTLFKNQGKWKDIELLTPENAIRMTTPKGYRNGAAQYGYGWRLETVPGNDEQVMNFGHGGGDALGGYHYPEQNTTVVYLSHSRRGDHIGAFFDMLVELDLTNELLTGSAIAPEDFEGAILSVSEDELNTFSGLYRDSILLMNISSNGHHLTFELYQDGFKTKRKRDLVYLGNNRFSVADHIGTAVNWLDPNTRLHFKVKNGKADSLEFKYLDRIIFAGNREK